MDGAGSDKAFDDLTHWPLEALPNNDAGAIEARRRAFEAAIYAFGDFFPDTTREENLEALEVALSEELEKVGLAWPETHWDDCRPTP